LYDNLRHAPSCTSFLSSWNGTAVNLREQVAIAVTALSPFERLVEYKKQRGFANLPFVSDTSASTPEPMSTLKMMMYPASASSPAKAKPSATSTVER
jgi:predicted dithiol-disulfide oxidoreductase (DUF899 family)